MEETEIEGRVLAEDAPAECRLNLVHIAAQHREAFLCIGQREEMVQIDAPGGAPGQMLGDQRRLDPVGQYLKPLEMARIYPIDAPEREAHRVEGEGIVTPDLLEGPARCPTTQLVFRM